MMKFKLGQVVMTSGAAASIPEGEMFEALNRHVSGDWGVVCKEDKKENDFSVENEGRIVSAYRTKAGKKFYIITEADNSVTAVLLPEEY